MEIFLSLLLVLGVIHLVQAQSQRGFISLDCGLPANEPSPYSESNYTGLHFSSDSKFIQTGEIGRIQTNLENPLKPYTTLRYFPEGTRNCYNLPVDKGRKYLIKAWFRYGNYDGHDIKPMFDLYIGPNLWATVDMQNLDGNSTSEEILHVPSSDSLQICLVKNGPTTPFISSLELRPLGNNSYITQFGSLKLFRRRYYTTSDDFIRYPDDTYDRQWFPRSLSWLTHISTTSGVSDGQSYNLPKAVRQSAATPTNASLPLTISWTPENPNDQFYMYLHFAEIQDLQANETREFAVFLDGNRFADPVIPKKFEITTIASQIPLTCEGEECNLQLTRTRRSTLPPLLNAYEIYKVMQFTQPETDETEVVALKSIQDTYKLIRINWQGDPCVPQHLMWDGLTCSISPRVTSLNLSSIGLTGTIAAAIQNLTQLEKLDLSNNKLTGELPDFLGNIKPLLFINLSGNDLNGSIPQSLQNKGIELLLHGNPRLCQTKSCTKPHSKDFPVVIVATAASVIILVAVLVLVFVLVFRKKNQYTAMQAQQMPPSMPAVVNIANANSHEPLNEIKRRMFTYSEVIKMTNNFQNSLGKGGFGMVYHGFVNGSKQVAVKVLSQSSTQGYKEFKAEVDLLLRVHHTNLVTLVGYCYEGDHLALIYEFLPNGDLKQHLTGKGGRPIINWSTRLGIALEAALGLEYLHIGCTPPMVHRDVKTANILLDDNFKAKLADFGLSRSFQGGIESRDFTAIAGTPGYLDPEYNHLGRLGEKSDVYSFGIVLLEMITNQPVISQTSENSHITKWVSSKLICGDIIEIMDPNLRKDYDSNSAWRAVELAMSCANPSYSKRPSMSQAHFSLVVLVFKLANGLQRKHSILSGVELIIKSGFGSTLPSKDDLIRTYEKFGALDKERSCTFENDSCARVSFLNVSEGEEAFYESLEKCPFATTSTVTFSSKGGEVTEKLKMRLEEESRNLLDKNMDTSLELLLVLTAILAIIHIVQAQDQKGFISLDCGLPSNESPYKESSSGLWFSSDENFTQGGKTGRVRETPERFAEQLNTLRYFPDGKRNCYNLNVEKGRRYLVRATFVYGNYDGLGMKPVFDIHLGPNLWATIDLQKVNGTVKDMLHIAASSSMQICLVKTGVTEPLISSLELRPMRNESYITESGSLDRYFRYYLSESSSQIRYSSDIYDRLWDPLFLKEWTQLSTANNVGNNNSYRPPEMALKTAATPTNSSAPLTIRWTSENPDERYYCYAHFSETEDLQANETREFNVTWNGIRFFGPFVPRRGIINTIFRTAPATCIGGICRFELIRTDRSTRPPLLNAFEVYTVIQFPQSETDESDVGAMKSIAATYALSRINWKGDPCVPRQFGWDGLNCSNTDMSMPPRITTLNLSSSGLAGTIADAVQNLTQLETLDLSNNSLTGGVPDFLGNMKSLLVINLSRNNLNGSIPQALQREGLQLFVEGNPRLCFSDSCKKPHKKKIIVPIVASVASAAIVIAVLVLLLVLKKGKPAILQGLHLLPRTSSMNATFAEKNSRRFTYSEVIKMTNNFQRVLGEGGFGMVYHGSVKGSKQVAVKVLSQSSTQGYKEFKAEVDLLLRVHHTNLVSLVGYCYEGDQLALVYEFLPNGDLKQHLSGKGGRSVINWSTRLQIALEAASGLEYLHIGCTPPMVHRDVKTANILLDADLKAKLADFGLSRSFQGGVESHDTAVAGTLGYLDPEYHSSGRLGEKSDVYSFGIVLLEMITNHPVINQTSESSHITQWVGFKLNRGDIVEIMDPNLHKDYDFNSAWRALELAMLCANPSSSKRPSMSQVIHEIKECLACAKSVIGKNLELEPQEIMSSGTSMVPMAR
ncbi:unnamed protein product [Brassica oleracea]